jgi:hypothetical protein
MVRAPGCNHFAIGAHENLEANPGASIRCLDKRLLFSSP